MAEDVTPDGEPIDTFTLWLPFPEGEAAVSLDLTKFNAAMTRAKDGRLAPTGRSVRADMLKIRSAASTSSSEIAKLQAGIRALADGLGE